MGKRIILIVLFTFSIAFAQDLIQGLEQVKIPANIQELYDAIKIAEDNQNWESYNQLRQEIISEWKKVNPDVAAIYRNVSDGVSDNSPAGTIQTEQIHNATSPAESILFEIPNSQLNPTWGDDVMITGGKAYDISMDISRDGEIYVAVLGRYDAASTEHDSVYIFKSTNGGTSWTQWGFIYVLPSDPKFSKIELMCFDGYPGSTGDSYLLLFYLFDNGWLRVGRTLTSSPSWNYYTITGSGSGGNTTDFAVDRNYPASNYRAICLYDSSNVIKSIRSEPTSNGTVWQDAVSLGLVGRDVDLCYGFNGGTYASFNGFNSGNLYVFENGNYADPLSWGSSITIATGSTDTTRHVEIISSRDGIPNNKATVVYERQDGSTYGLYYSLKPSGSSTWGSPVGWVTVRENKWPSLYSAKVNANQVFQGVFEQSDPGNFPPRSIRYKPYTGSGWSTSVEVSDASNDVTGIQKPEVGELNSGDAVFAFVGANYVGVYFDNESWSPSAVESEINPTQFSLEQNYPNPFNPNTSIKFSILQNSSVKLKVYDVIGNEIATLINDQKDAGNYEVIFNASRLSSGVYFYKLEAIPLNGEKSFVQTKKMILMK